MLKTQNQLIAYVESVDREIKIAAAEVSIPNMIKISDDVSSKTAVQVAAITDTQLLIPVIGAFSAGKSSLLNAFMGRSHLPVAITPETALATELHYGSDEYVEAVGADGKVQKFLLKDFAQITARASEFQYLRAYINSESLKSIQPLVLVDMPGFDSPLDAHNEAITLFRDRGAHFVFLTSVEEGGLHKQALRQMREVLDLGRRFSVCLSKSDLKPESQVKEIQAHIADQLTTEVGDMGDVIALNQENAQQQLSKLVSDIDPEFITAALHSPYLRKAYSDTDAALHTVAESLGKSKQEIAEKLESIKSAMADLEQERDRQLRDISAPDAEDLALPVISALKGVLQNSINDLVAAAMKDSRSLELELNELVRSTVGREVLVATEKFSAKAVARFEKFAQDYVKVDLQLPTDLVQIGLDAIKSPLLGQFAKLAGGKAIKKVAMTTTTRLGGVALGVAAAGPIGAIAMAVVPELVEYLFGKFKSSRQREAITQALQTDVFNQVLEQMSGRVKQHMTQVAQSVVESISQDMNDRLQSQCEIYAVQESQHQEEVSALDAKTKCIEKTRKTLTKLAADVALAA